MVPNQYDANQEYKLQTEILYNSYLGTGYNEKEGKKKEKKKENQKYSKTSLYLRNTQKLFVFKGQFCHIFLNF